VAVRVADPSAHARAPSTRRQTEDGCDSERSLPLAADFVVAKLPLAQPIPSLSMRLNLPRTNAKKHPAAEDYILGSGNLVSQSGGQADQPVRIICAG